jgi:hypothetical protein
MDCAAMMVDFQLVAKVMLGVFILLGIVSLVMTIRVLTRKPEPNPTKLAATERSLLLSSWVLMPIVGNAINVPVGDQPEGAGTTMPHSDIVPDHECNGEIDRRQRYEIRHEDWVIELPN